MKIFVVDTETTGFEKESNSLVEFASVELETGDWMTSLVRPRHPISFGAMATHHITEDMVANAPELESVLSDAMQDAGVVMVAHNAEFDSGFLPEWLAQKPWICTWRCAMQVWPDAESHSNQSLRYELGLDVSDMPEAAGGMAHRALYDAWVTTALARRIIQETGKSVEELVALTKEPILLRTVRFGKHRGEKWEDVPKSYLRWMLGQEFDSDVHHTARFYLR